MTSPGKLDPADPDALIPAHVLADMQQVHVPQELLDQFDELKNQFVKAATEGWVKRERPARPTEQVYVGIGNSDDYLTQAQWAEFIQDVKALLDANAIVRGEWFSAPDSFCQNACWWIAVDGATNVARLQVGLQDLGRLFHQDSIAWTPVRETLFIKQDSMLPLD